MTLSSLEIYKNKTTEEESERKKGGGAIEISSASNGIGQRRKGLGPFRATTRSLIFGDVAIPCFKYLTVRRKSKKKEKETPKNRKKSKREKDTSPQNGAATQ